MANPYFPALSVSVAGTGSSATLIGASAGQSTRVWQVLIGATTNDSTAQFTFTVAGTSTTEKCAVALGTTVLPMTGVPWMQADVNTTITFTAASTTHFNVYYSKAQGG